MHFDRSRSSNFIFFWSKPVIRSTYPSKTGPRASDMMDGLDGTPRYTPKNILITGGAGFMYVLCRVGGMWMAAY